MFPNEKIIYLFEAVWSVIQGWRETRKSWELSQLSWKSPSCGKPASSTCRSVIRPIRPGSSILSHVLRQHHNHCPPKQSPFRVRRLWRAQSINSSRTGKTSLIHPRIPLQTLGNYLSHKGFAELFVAGSLQFLHSEALFQQKNQPGTPNATSNTLIVITEFLSSYPSILQFF